MKMEKEIRRVFKNLPIGFTLEIAEIGERTLLSKYCSSDNFYLLVADSSLDNIRIMKLVVSNENTIQVSYADEEATYLFNLSVTKNLVELANETPYLKGWMEMKLELKKNGKIVAVEL